MKENKEIVINEGNVKESKLKVFADKAKATVKRNWKPFLGGAVIATLASLALASRKYGEDDLCDPSVENEIDVWNNRSESDNDSQEEESE